MKGGPVTRLSQDKENLPGGIKEPKELIIP
jgi:hypothetical protein